MFKLSLRPHSCFLARSARQFHTLANIMQTHGIVVNIMQFYGIDMHQLHSRSQPQSFVPVRQGYQPLIL